jgi:diguanylate cyclase (GGDEF)-like protein/PAS domain S-box-containing protein/hemerythrin-like metal-binding protein
VANRIRASRCGWGTSVLLILVVVLAGWLPAGMAQQSYLYAGDPTVYPRWLYPILAVMLALMLLGGLAMLRIYRLNHQLRREVRERRTSEVRFRDLVEQSLMGIYIIQDDRFVYVNPKFAEIFGYSMEDIIGRLGPPDLVAPADREQIGESLRRCLDGETDSISHTFGAIRKDGSPLDIEITGEMVDYEGRPAIVGMVLDITERKRAQQQLKYLAFYDPLTDLPNRALCFDRLGQALAWNRRCGESFALLLLDLDGFKAVNDSHGHKTGDALLQAVGRRLRDCVRECDTVARMGGDEFVVLLPHLREPDHATLVAGKIVVALAEPFLLAGDECRVSASIGLCIAPEDGRDIETLLGRADAAMYDSKARGKNTWTRYRPALPNGKPVKMAFLEWNEELCVGVPVIDEQHARLAGMLNRIGDAVKTGQEAERIMALLDELVTFTRHHFETEERLMDQLGYADALIHQQAHRKLVGDLLSIKHQFDSASLMLTFQALKEWLNKHITDSDRRLAEALVASNEMQYQPEQGAAS